MDVFKIPSWAVVRPSPYCFSVVLSMSAFAARMLRSCVSSGCVVKLRGLRKELNRFAKR